MDCRVNRVKMVERVMLTLPMRIVKMAVSDLPEQLQEINNILVSIVTLHQRIVRIQLIMPGHG